MPPKPSSWTIATKIAEEPFFSDGGAEPFFVKSLENVQGDQREAIFISVGYGRDRVGGFRIDLAIRDPERSGRYYLGIECDGAQYHRARWVRDRDRIRQQVLESRGWIIHRIWSTDWFQRPEEQLEKVFDALADAKRHWDRVDRDAAARSLAERGAAEYRCGFVYRPGQTEFPVRNRRPNGGGGSRGHARLGDRGPSGCI